MDYPRILALFGSSVVFGQERGNIEALAALKEQGCDVLCLIRDEAWARLIPVELNSRGLPWIKVPYIEHWMPGRLRWVIFRNPIAFIIANYRFLRIVSQYRPTHIHAFNHIYVLNFLVALLIVRTPMVFRAGDQPVMHNLFWSSLWHFIVRRTSRFVANSKFIAEALASKGVSADRITLVYNAPPRRVVHKNDGEVPCLNANARSIVYIGQISEHKGVHLLIDAFRIVARDYQEVHLLLAGRILDWSGHAWAQELRASALTDPVIGKRVSFLGDVSDVPGLLARSELHIAPSLFEARHQMLLWKRNLRGSRRLFFLGVGYPNLWRTMSKGSYVTKLPLER